MKILFYGLIIIAVVMYLLYQKGIIFANFESISASEAYKLYEKNRDVVFLDVRTDAEFNSDGHIKGAILIPSSGFDAQISQLEKYKDKKIIVYCRSGSRSAGVARILTNSGYNAINLSGGIVSWKSNNYKLER